MAEELKAVALTAPEPSGWRHLTRADWERFGKHAGLPAIEYMLKQARADQRRARRAVQRLEALAAQRAAQVAAGEWPPPAERVTWGELRPGDVLLDGPDKETLAEEVETRNGQTIVRYRVNGTLYWRSQPVGQEITIRPRVPEAAADSRFTIPGESPEVPRG